MRGKPASTAFLDVGEQVVEGVQYPEVGAGDHVGVGSAQQGVQGDTRAFAFEGPPEDFDGRLGEAVALEGGQAGVQFDGGVELAADDERSEDLGDEVIDGARPTRARSAGRGRGVASDQAVTPSEVALTRTESMAWSSP